MNNRTLIILSGFAAVVVMAYLVSNLATPCKGSYEFSLKELGFNCKSNDDESPAKIPNSKPQEQSDNQNVSQDISIYRYQSEPYFWARGKDVSIKDEVIDKSTYTYIGNGKWKREMETALVSDQTKILFKNTEFNDEKFRNNGEVQVLSNGTPFKLTDNGLYIYRNYPRTPVPKGIDPNEIKWWRMYGTGQWIQGKQ